MDGIKKIAEIKGLQYSPPVTILESGSAHGDLKDMHWEIYTRPTLWPPGYGLQIRILGANTGFKTNKIDVSVKCAQTKMFRDTTLIHYSCTINAPDKIRTQTVIDLVNTLEESINPDPTLYPDSSK